MKADLMLTARHRFGWCHSNKHAKCIRAYVNPADNTVQCPCPCHQKEVAPV